MLFLKFKNQIHKMTEIYYGDYDDGVRIRGKGTIQIKKELSGLNGKYSPNKYGGIPAWFFTNEDSDEAIKYVKKKGATEETIEEHEIIKYQRFAIHDSLRLCVFSAKIQFSG